MIHTSTVAEPITRETAQENARRLAKTYGLPVYFFVHVDGGFYATFMKPKPKIIKEGLHTFLPE